jgi:hypothetical protein
MLKNPNQLTKPQPLPFTKIKTMKKTLLLTLITIGLFSCEKLTFKKADTNFTETCIEINSLTIVQTPKGNYELLNDGQHFLYFGNFEEAAKTKDLMEFYQVAEHCTCGTGIYTEKNGESSINNDLMMYHKTSDGLGIGNEEYNSYQNSNEDCLPFDPERVVAKKRLNGEWYLVEAGNHLMFHFGKDKEACYNALKAIKKYKYNQSCFVGRPMASFAYLKRYREDFESYQGQREE